MGQKSKFLLDKTYNTVTWKNNITSIINIKNLFFKYKISRYLTFFFIKNSFTYKFFFLKINKLKKYCEQIFFFKNISKKKNNKFRKRIYISQINLLLLNNWIIIKFATIVIRKFKIKRRRISTETFARLGYFYIFISNTSKNIFF